MSPIVRTAALLVVFIAAGCVGKAEVAQTVPSAIATPADSWLPYSAMHAAIRPGKTDGNVPEYH